VLSHNLFTPLDSRFLILFSHFSLSVSPISFAHFNAAWKLEGKILNVNYSGPEGTKISFVRNDSHKSLKVVLNHQNKGE